MSLFRRLGRRYELYRQVATRALDARCERCGSWRSPDTGPCPDCGYRPPHEVLGVDPDAPDAVVKAAAREKLKVAHPDQGGSGTEFQRVKEARDRLLG